MESSRRDEAEAEFRRALELDPSDPANHLNLARLLERRGRLEEAEVALRHAVELAPEDPELHRQLGLLIESQGEEGDIRRSEAVPPRTEPLTPGSALGQRLEEGSKLEIIDWRYPASLAAGSALGLLLSLIELVRAPEDGDLASWIFVAALLLSLVGFVAAAGLYFERRRQVQWIRHLLDSLEALPSPAVTAAPGDAERMAGATEELVVHLDRAGAFEESRRLLDSVGGLALGRKQASSGLADDG